MKKVLLLLYISVGFSYMANAQCKTCKQGAHDPKDPSVFYSSPVPYSLNSKFTPSPLNGNHTLGQSYIQQNVCGLNYMTSSVEITTRATWQPGSGFPATLKLTGCMAKSVQKAFMYWEASYTEATPPTTSVTLTNPVPTTGTFSGTLIGTDASKCWGETGTATYRADITSIVTTAGSYTINSLNGFNNAAYEVDGATMVVIYTVGSATYSGSIALYDGCYTALGSPESYTATGFNVCGNSSVGSAFGVFGDMQNNITPNTNTETFNGSTLSFPNNFWNYDSVPTTFTSGQTSSVFNAYTNVVGDCYAWILAGLYWQNTNCVTCVPKTLSITTTVTNPTCGSNNGSITVGVTGGTLPYTYNWSPNVSTSAIATGLSVGVYVITVTDSTGCNAATDTVLLVNPTGPTLTTATVPIKCFGGSGGSASVTATGGTPGYTYAWSPGGATTTSITGLTAGSYTVLVTDSKGCQSVAIANVNQPLPFSVGIDSLLNVKCNGGNNGAIYVTGSGGTPSYTYSWSTGQTTTDITGLSPGSYKITITDANGCMADTTLSVTQPAPMAISVTSYDATCGLSNGTAWVWNVTGGSSPYTYLWSNGYPGSYNFGLSAGSYCCTVTDANGCEDSVCVTVNNIVPFTISATGTSPTCYGGNNGNATVTVTGGGSPWTYSWSTTPVQTNATATNLSAATYTITVTDNSGCASSAIVTLTQPPQMTCSVVPMDPTICIGENVSLTATAGGGTSPYTYTWDNTVTANPYTVSPVATTVYTVVATDMNGCKAPPITDTVKVHKPITVSISPTGITSCSGDTTVFTATASGGNGVYSYTWSPGGQTGSTVKLTTSTTTIYTVTVTDTCSSPAGTASVKVTINPTPVVGFTADTLSGCGPLCIKFNDTTTITGGTIKSWKWTFGDGGTDTASSPPKYCYDSAGNYTVSLTVTSDSGCSSSYTNKNMISVFNNPKANFVLSPQPTTILAPTIYFTDLSTDKYGITSWMWTFGDILDSISTSKNSVHTYADTGTFCATLRVVNVHGCVDSITECLVIDPQFTLYIPDAFSPNGNGLNDIFMPKGEALRSYDMYIFNRWGTLLFHTNDLMKGWDGTVNHRICQEDTYVYLIKILDNYNKKHTYIGKVTLIK